jgi:hypothetical protein
VTDPITVGLYLLHVLIPAGVAVHERLRFGALLLSMISALVVWDVVSWGAESFPRGPPPTDIEWVLSVLPIVGVASVVVVSDWWAE